MLGRKLKMTEKKYELKHFVKTYVKEKMLLCLEVLNAS